MISRGSLAMMSNAKKERGVKPQRGFCDFALGFLRINSYC